MSVNLLLFILKNPSSRGGLTGLLACLSVKLIYLPFTYLGALIDPNASREVVIGIVIISVLDLVRFYYLNGKRGRP